ncbi:MAG: FG-GAP repeat domain-containing protein, partial [Pirellulaceae bacterium]
MAWLIPLLLLFAGCRPADKKPASGPSAASAAASVRQAETPSSEVTDRTPFRIRFADRSADSGIQVRYNDGREDEVYSIIESLGGGLAAFDYDCDGHVDLAYAEGGRFRAEQKEVVGLPGWLYQGLGDWRFRPVLQQSRLDLSRHYQHGVHVSDFDNDGFPDLLVTGYGGLQLWHNVGDGTFQEVASVVGLVDPNWSSTAAWGDLEGDGDLDLLVAHYADWSFDNNPPCVVRGVRDVCGPRDFRGVDHLFFRNLGDGRFEPMPKGFLAPGGRGLGVLASDLDADGDTDWYVANDEEANYLYRNEGDGRLTEIGLRSGTALDDAGTPDGSMGVGVGDYNNDGKFDLFVTHYETETCALYSQSSRLNFLHMSRRTNVTAMGSLFVGWGVVFNDYDLDGDEDLVTVNGHAVRQSQLAPVDQLPVLLENLNGKSFRMAGELAGSFFQKPVSARGLA